MRCHHYQKTSSFPSSFSPLRRRGKFSLTRVIPLLHIMGNKRTGDCQTFASWEENHVSTIDIDRLEMRFGNFTALKDISVSVKEGEFVTLLGPSGCGKTTLLKLISGFLKPTNGTIKIANEDVTLTPPEHRDTALCFQSYALFPHLTIKDNIEFGLKQKRVNGSERKQRLQDMAGQLALDAQLDKLPNQLSGGQQQRVALGRALIMRPGVILFDEPLSNLDAKLRDSVRVEIRRIQQENNLTAVYVTHDQSEALAMSDRVMVLNGGVIEQVAPPETLYNAPSTSFVADFIGGANIMNAEVTGETEPGVWALQTPIGEMVSKSDRTPAAKHIKVCWRPEAVKLVDSPVNSFTARVTERQFQGSYTDLFVDIGGNGYRLKTSDPGIYPGENINCSIEPSDLILLEAIQ
ncbi:ABC transporter ATP-binding protein [Candidatus Halocynthiibacter alkanivorans]|uniref:ABC transporter ATP-binding protein n=1 Tax=Candidatus Halocynthiibacter alkanivorans TaxID=2267619 RepID=UPI001F2479CD|nr:ABC transporter ATP-binding protein [Candidatus Halocynthiibacter alkanivorans]